MSEQPATKESAEVSAAAVSDAVSSLCTDVCEHEGDLDQNVRAIATLSSTLSLLCRAAAE